MLAHHAQHDPAIPRRPRFLRAGVAATITVAATVGLCGPAAASELVRSWINPEGGAFGDWTNWSPQTVPGSGHTALFDLAAAYTVTFAQDRTIGAIHVHQGDVTLDLRGFTVQQSSHQPLPVLVGGTTDGGARLRLSGGGRFQRWRTAIAPDPGSTGEVVLTDGVRWDSIWVGVGGDDTAAGGTGVLTIDSGELHNIGALHIWSGGTVNLLDGRIAVRALHSAGELNLAGGELLLHEVEGDLVNQGATVRLGPYPAWANWMQINGDFSQGKDGTLSLRLFGHHSRPELVIISGHAQLAGTLEVTGSADANVRPGDTFELLRWDSVSGGFDSFELPELASPRWTWDTEALNQTGWLTAIGKPEMFRHWATSNDGAFGDAVNWTPTGIPEPDQVATFDRGSAYTVHFTQDHETFGLEVRDDDVTINLANHTYKLVDASVGTEAGTVGQLTILDGRLDSERAVIGRDPGSTGKITVGPGVVWTSLKDDSEGEMHIGRRGIGRLRIEDAEVITSTSSIGKEAGSMGHVAVTGQEGRWIHRKSGDTPSSIGVALNVGEEGSGTLEISNGGFTSAAYMYIGHRADSSGAVEVTGEGSSLELAVPASDDSDLGFLEVGFFGNGNLLISESAQTTVHRVGIARRDGSSGTITVKGAGSKLEATGPLRRYAPSDARTLEIGASAFGESAAGSLEILDGGEVWSQHGIRAHENSRISVSGEGSTLQLGLEGLTMSQSELSVRDGGRIVGPGVGLIATDALVSGGGRLMSPLFVNPDASVIIRDEGSAIIAERVNVGSTSALGTARLNVEAGGAVDAESVRLQQDGILLVDNGTLRAGEIRVAGGTLDHRSGMVQVGDEVTAQAGEGIMIIGGGPERGLSITDGGLAASPRSVIANSSAVTGVARIEGERSQWLNSELHVGALGRGIMQVRNGGRVATAGDAFIGTWGGASGEVLVSGPQARWVVLRSMYMGGSADTPGGMAELTIDSGGVVYVQEDLKLWPSATVNLREGTLTAHTIEQDGQLNFTGGRLQVWHHHGNLVNEGGTLAPGRFGQPIGMVNIYGNYTQLADATLEIELAGLEAGTEHDQLNVPGHLALDGTLDVRLIDEFQPQWGDEFQIFNWLSRSGDFHTLDLPALQPGLAWDTSDLFHGLLAVTMAGDANRDGRVDGEDLLVWQSNFGMNSGATLADGDFNNDGRVDGEDFLIWQANFGNTADTFAAVTPEPAAAAAVVFGLAGLAVHRRRR